MSCGHGRPEHLERARQIASASYPYSKNLSDYEKGFRDGVNCGCPGCVLIRETWQKRKQDLLAEERKP